MHPTLSFSAREIASKIRSGALSSRDVVEAHVRRVEEVNPVLNAVVRDRFLAARREADAADRALAEGRDDLGPLHGVPCTIKESFALAGMPNTGGLVARQGRLAERDSVAVARVRAAGAIPLGITNVSELCMWWESSNRVYGRSNNPYDPSCCVGGSSGGEGAIVGSGASPFGLGSDIGGSIRIPAFFNGVFGHKSTGGLVPATGQFPIPHGHALRMMTSGPIARRAEDLMPILRVLAGTDAGDPECFELHLGDPDAIDVGRLRVVSIEENGFSRVDPELVGVQRRVEAHLRSRGASVTRARSKDVLPELASSLEIWSARMSTAGGPSFSAMLGNGHEVDVGRELLKWTFGRSPHTLPALVLAFVERFPHLAEARMNVALEAFESLKEKLVALVGKDGVLLYPSFTQPAPRHHRPLLNPFQFSYPSILNALEVPSTQVPLGLGTRGLPLGVQVASVHGNDHVTIAVALELERAFGGWVPPRIARAG